jgi:hypothetical protein
MRRFSASITTALLAVALGGCVGSGAPSIRLALDGPSLHVAAKSASHTLSGAMDRSCMAGVGGILLYDKTAGVSCQGQMDRPADDRGRMYIDLTCSDGGTIIFVMRNLGPDQGMGIGRFEGSGESATMFYHPCEDEAVRRLDQLRDDINAALERKKKPEEEEEEEEEKKNAKISSNAAPFGAALFIWPVHLDMWLSP